MCHAAVRWFSFLLFFSSVLGQARVTIPITSLGQNSDSIQEDAVTVTTASTDPAIEQFEYTTESTTQPDNTGTDIQKSEIRTSYSPENPSEESLDVPRGGRGVIVYVKPDSTSDAKNISDLPDLENFDGAIVKAGEKETIVITDPNDDGNDDFLLMEERSLHHNFSEPQNKELKQPQPPPLRNLYSKNAEFLVKWGRELADKEGSDLLKMNVASFFAKEYEEMNELMNENLVGRNRNDFGSSQMVAEPRLDEDVAERRVINAPPLYSLRDLESSESAPMPVFIAAPPPSFAQKRVQRVSSGAPLPQRRPSQVTPSPSQYQVVSVTPPMSSRRRQSAVRQGYRANKRADTVSTSKLTTVAGTTPQEEDTRGKRTVIRSINNGQRMALIPTTSMMQLQKSLPRTNAQASQQRATVSPKATVTPKPTPPTSSRRRPQPQQQNGASPKPTTRAAQFGDRFRQAASNAVNYVMNTSFMKTKQVNNEDDKQAPTHLYSSRGSSTVPIPASSQHYPSTVRAPSRYYLRLPGLSGTGMVQSPASKNRFNQMTSAVPTVPTRNVSESRKPATEGSLAEFGARIRPQRLRQSPTTGTEIPVKMNPKKETNKEDRDMKINQLRSNLVGKLVVIQSMLNEKQAKSEKMVRGRDKLGNATVYKGGILKPIVPLRPPLKFGSTSSTPSSVSSSSTEEEITSTEPTPVPKDKKKYRRPPSLRKSNQTLSSNEPEIKLTTTPATESASVVATEEKLSVAENTTTLPPAVNNIQLIGRSGLLPTNSSETSFNESGTTNENITAAVISSENILQVPIPVSNVNVSNGTSTTPKSAEGVSMENSPTDLPTDSAVPVTPKVASENTPFHYTLEASGSTDKISSSSSGKQKLSGVFNNLETAENYTITDEQLEMNKYSDDLVHSNKDKLNDSVTLEAVKSTVGVLSTRHSDDAPVKLNDTGSTILNALLPRIKDMHRQAADLVQTTTGYSDDLAKKYIPVKLNDSIFIDSVQSNVNIQSNIQNFSALVQTTRPVQLNDSILLDAVLSNSKVQPGRYSDDLTQKPPVNGSNLITNERVYSEAENQTSPIALDDSVLDTILSMMEGVPDGEIQTSPVGFSDRVLDTTLTKRKVFPDTEDQRSVGSDGTITIIFPRTIPPTVEVFPDGKNQTSRVESYDDSILLDTVLPKVKVLPDDAIQTSPVDLNDGIALDPISSKMEVLSDDQIQTMPLKLNDSDPTDTHISNAEAVYPDDQIQTSSVKLNGSIPSAREGSFINLARNNANRLTHSTELEPYVISDLMNFDRLLIERDKAENKRATKISRATRSADHIVSRDDRSAEKPERDSSKTVPIPIEMERAISPNPADGDGAPSILDQTRGIGGQSYRPIYSRLDKLPDSSTDGSGNRGKSNLVVDGNVRDITNRPVKLFSMPR